MTEWLSHWIHSYNHKRGTVFYRTGKSNEKLSDTLLRKNKNRGADSISARRDHGARRCCGVRGVPCDDLFPQSEPAPLAVFGPTLHSSAAQLYHTPLP